MSSFYDLTAKTLDGTEVRLFYTIELLVSLCRTVVGVYDNTTEILTNQSFNQSSKTFEISIADLCYYLKNV